MIIAVIMVTITTIAVIVTITGALILLPTTLSVTVDFFHNQQSLPVNHFNALTILSRRAFAVLPLSTRSCHWAKLLTYYSNHGLIRSLKAPRDDSNVLLLPFLSSKK